MKRCRLIYRSKAKLGAMQQHVLSAIAKTSAENNKRDGVVGVLILSGNQFLQVLEGPVRYVNQLYIRIIKDARHQGVELIKYELIDSPYFFDWSMRIVNLDTLQGTEKEKLLKKYPHQDGQLVITDNLILIYSLMHDARDMF